jgi:hypothetical protein
MNWNNNLDVSGVGSVFAGIIGQLNYLKSKVDDMEIKSSGDTSSVVLENMMDEVSKTYATKVTVDDLSTEMHIEMKKLREDLSKKDDQHKHMTQVLEKQQAEIHAMQSEIKQLRIDMEAGDQGLRVSLDELQEDVTDFQDDVGSKFGDVFSSMRATEESMMEVVAGVKEEVDAQNTVVEKATTRVSKLSDTMDVFNGQFKFVRDRVDDLVRLNSELRHDHEEAVSSQKIVEARVEELDVSKADLYLLDDKADRTLLVEKADVVDLLKMNHGLQDHGRKHVLSVSHQKDELKQVDNRLTKRIDFLMNIVRDLQVEASDEADEDARLKCLACNKPIGTMGDDTPYKKDHMKNTIELKKKGDADPDASPERRRPISRGPVTPFEPSGQKSQKKNGAGANLKRLYATPVERDPLSKEVLRVPDIHKGDRLTPMTDSSMRMSSAGAMRLSQSAAAAGFEAYVTVGKHLNYSEMTGAIAGYPSLTGGLIPESSEYQKKRPGTAPAARRGRASAVNQ